MFLIYSNENADRAASREEQEKIMAGHWAMIEESRARGVFRAADPLHPTQTATTVRMQDGKAITTDGPFAETKEQLAGYYILDCQDLDEAIAWAAKIPTACKGGEGCVEIRPILEIPASEEMSLPAANTGSFV
jgi:hypothetical protein